MKARVFFFPLALALVALIVAGAAQSASYTATCDGAPAAPIAGMPDAAIEVRLLRQEFAHFCAVQQEHLEAIEADLSALADATTDPGSPAQRVALAQQDRDRLDLMWWGVWFAAGVACIGLIASRWMNVWRFGS